MISPKVLFVLFIWLAFISVAYCVEFSPCPNEAKYGKLNKIEVTNCGEDDVKCPFNVGKNVSMNLSFETTENFDTAKIKIAGILSTIPVPFRINPDTVCDYGAACPLKKSESNNIFLQFPIKQTYPKINLVVQLQFLGPSNESIVCIRFPAHIV